MPLRFGSGETATCIADAAMRGPDGESLCVAYKTSWFALGAGVYLTDDGYVLKFRDRDGYLPLPRESTVRELQQQALLPKPLPDYTISSGTYFAGYSFWFYASIVALAVLFGWRRARARREVAAQTYEGDLVVRSKADRFVLAEMKKTLEPSEELRQQAYALNRRPTRGIVSAALTKAYFVGLTDRRLIVIETRVGAFSPILEKLRIRDIAREDVVRVRRDDEDLCFEMRDGSTLELWIDPSERHMSNQQAFLRGLPERF